MMKPDEYIRVELRFSDADEMKVIQEELLLSSARNIGEYDGVIEAEIPVAALEHLRNKKILIDFPADQEITVSEKPALADDSSGNETIALKEEKEWLAKFKKKGKRIEINRQTNEVNIISQEEADKKQEEEKIIFPESNNMPETSGVDEAGAGEETIALPEINTGVATQEELSDAGFYFVVLKGPVNHQAREFFKANAISLTANREKESRHSYTTCLTTAQHKALISSGLTLSVSEYAMEDKIMTSLEENLVKEETGLETFTLARTLEIALSGKEYAQKVTDIIEKSGQGKVLDAGQNIIRIEADVQSPLIAALTDLPYVSSISVYEAPKLFCDVSRETLGLNFAAPSFLYEGESEIVAVIDSGIDATHPDLQKRVKESLQYGAGLADDMVGHGTHVAGIICGDGTASGGKIKGIAPAVQVISIGVVDASMSMDLPADLGKLLQMAVDKGAKVINLSWGFKISGEYNHGAFSIDQFLYNNPEITVVVAAGNEGRFVNDKIEYKSIGVPASAKNVITVGAATTRRTIPAITETWGIRNPANFPAIPYCNEKLASSVDFPSAVSSRGPTEYKSIKPELLAPGNYILAAKATKSKVIVGHKDYYDQHYTFKTGTSMAAPLVSGTVLLLREFLRKEYNNSNPSSSLLKAIMIACCHKIDNNRQIPDTTLQKIGFPDFDQGFGLLVPGNLLNNKTMQLQYADIRNDDSKALQSRAPLGGAIKSFREYVLEITDSNQELSIVLCWLDPPAKGLQNNLQLSVKIPSGDWKLGNAEHIYHVDALTDVVNAYNLNRYDSDNSVEKITISNPATGKYVLKINAQSTVDKAQGYSLVVMGKLLSFTER